MTISRLTSLVSTGWLRSQLTAGRQAQIKLLDTSWSPMKSGHEDYISKHIPGALFFDLNQHLRPTPLIPRNPPEASDFQEYARQLGINTDTNLVLYDRGESPVLAACRAWWTFRLFGHDTVSVLDGGLKKWMHEGGDVETGEGDTPQLGNFVSHLRPDLMASYEDMEDILQKKKISQILDVRKAPDFNGETEEPTQFTKNACLGTGQPLPTRMKKGHMSGAVNVPFDSIFKTEVQDNYLEMKDLSVIKDALDKAGIDVQAPLAISCYAGNTACTWMLAAHMMGNENVAMYCGSWTEWSQRADQ